MAEIGRKGGEARGSKKGKKLTASPHNGQGMPQGSGRS
jgi:hypothetical protein